MRPGLDWLDERFANWYLDGNGDAHPVPDWNGEGLIRWARWYEVADRRVALDEIGPYRVSTVFMSVNMNFGFGPPILWETAVFKNDDLDAIAGRYASREQALEGHAHVVRTIRDGQYE